MELDVTHMVEEADEMFNLSGSKMEHGQNASKITWSNALVYAQDHPLLKTDEERDAARRHFKEYGGWTEEHIAGWSEEELQAITVQDVAGTIREMEIADTYEEYQKLAEEGTVSGRLYKGDDNRWYYYLGT